METILQLDAFKLIGLALPGQTTNHDGQSSRDCGKLWQQFEVEGIAGRIPGKVDDAIYAVYFAYEGDDWQLFSYFIGCKVALDAPDLSGLQSLNMPSQRYLQKVAHGTMPDCVANTWRDIWTSDLTRAYGYDFERYDERSHDWSNATVDLFLSI